MTIAACGFGPSLSLIGTDSDSVYAVSAAQTYVRLVPETGEVTRLYHSLSSWQPLAEIPLETVIHGDRLYYPDDIEVGGGFARGLVSIDAHDESTTPRVEMIGEQYEPRGAMIGDDHQLWFGSIVHTPDFGAYTGPVVAVTYGGAQTTPITPGAGQPVAAVDGYVYYRADATLARIAIAGGSATTIATDLAPGSRQDRAIDGSFAYGTTAAAPYELRRFSVTTGASELVGVAGSGDPEVEYGAPHDLRVDGDDLYYLQSVSDYEALFRISLAGTGTPVQVITRAAMSPPVFDATSIYVAYQRGGYDEPLEGVIGKLAK